MSKHDVLKEIDSKDLETTTGGAGPVGDSVGGGIQTGRPPGMPGPTFPRPFPFPTPGEPGRPRPQNCMACGMG